jgi:S-ribosylhomocysteine lyase
MEKIASFQVDHNKVSKGMYISRIDDDIITYDIRMKIPNGGDYLKYDAIHTFEHLFATYARNTEYSKNIIYVGPMGCQTGFYFLVRDKMSHQEALMVMVETLKFIIDFEGEIPGSKMEECGNYLSHSLEGAKEIAKDMLPVLENWSVDKMNY